MRYTLARGHGAVKRPSGRLTSDGKPGDFTVGREILRLVALAVPIGVVGALCALVLVDLIGLLTNALYFARLGTAIPSLTRHRQGLLAMALPILGGLTVGLMAKFGSEQIRGHGIPEAIETILTRGSRIAPRLAILKPISSAVSIGTGGPFGAEGPIILTGGAAGSLLAQHFTLSAAERKVLLVCGAAAGMSGVFGTPVAATLMAVELLLFEWKPRSLIPVATASLTAMAVRTALADAGLMHPAPLFAVGAHGALPAAGLLCAAAMGVIGGLLAWAISAAVHGSEDAYRRLPLHWMWWPMIGGVAVGVGGAIDRRALGVGYDTIGAELSGHLALQALVGILVVKLAIWSVALGSGNSGGVVAPVLMMGAAAGGILAPVMDGGSPGLWCLIGMTATFAAVLRTPLTAVVFALELTAVSNALMPLMVAAITAYLVSVLVLKRSILTEKVARSGVHVVHEYAVDLLEALRVCDVMSTEPVTLDAEDSVPRREEMLRGSGSGHDQQLFPVTGADGGLVGVLAASDLNGECTEPGGRVAHLARPSIVARPHETLRAVADRMIANDVTTLPVVDDRRPPRVIGLVDQRAFVDANLRHADQEHTRERVFDGRRQQASD